RRLVDQVSRVAAGVASVVLRLEEGIGALNQIQHQWRENQDTIRGFSSLTAPRSSLRDEGFKGGHKIQSQPNCIVLNPQGRGVKGVMLQRRFCVRPPGVFPRPPTPPL